MLAGGRGGVNHKWEVCSSKNNTQAPGPPTYQNYQSSESKSNQHDESDKMKFACTLKNTLLIIRDRFGLSFASKGLGYLVALLSLLSLLARYKLSCYQTTLLLPISALEDITLQKTTCHFLLLLVGFDTPTYQKELQLIPYTCGSSVYTKRENAGS